MTADSPDLPTDPTAFRTAAVTATRDAQVGLELEPIVRLLSLDKSRIYQGWPANRNRHTDYAAAQATDLREPNINGGQTAELIGEAYLKFFRQGFLGGTLAVSFLGYVNVNDEVTVRGRVVNREERGDTVVLTVELTAQTQEGRTVLAAKGTGVV